MNATAAYGLAPTAAMMAQALCDADELDDLDVSAVRELSASQARFWADDGEYEYEVTVTRRSSRG